MIDNFAIVFSCGMVIYVAVRAALLDRKERDAARNRTTSRATSE
jgi:hypothetical protein